MSAQRETVDPFLPESADLLISGGYVLTMDDGQRSYYPGSVAVRGRRIVAVGPSVEVDARFKARERITADNHVVMPGLVNTHGHASNSLIRGLGSDLPLHQWLEQVCWPCMYKATEEDLYHGVLLSCLEMLRNGVTTFADMWIGVGPAARAVEESGLRAMLAYNIKGFDDPVQGEHELRDAVDAWQRWHGYADGRVNVGLGPHSVYTCRPELLAECAQLARQKDIHVQIHGHETEHEVTSVRGRYGRTPIELMDDVGLLREGTLVAHAVHLSDGEVARLKASRTTIAHNIASNLKLASGIAPIHRYRAAGICVGLGTDGPGSNDSLDPLQDLKYASLIQKAISGDATCMSADTALAMATRAGGEALGLGTEIGILEEGRRADMILVDLDRPHFTPHHFDYSQSITSLLVYCASGTDVSTVIVDGQVLMLNGELIRLDIETIMKAAQASSEAVLARAGWL